LPDKAIDLIDEASSRVRIQKHSTPITLKEARRLADSIRKEKETALAQQQYDYAAEKRQQEIQMVEKIKTREKVWQVEQ
jgi:ATP-dependent Clp protease ATP-binding subunit ClpC